MYSLIPGNHQAPSNTATNYSALGNSNVLSWNTTESNRGQLVPHVLTLDRLLINLTTAPGTGKSYAFTVMKNGVATALTCTVSDLNLTASDTVNSASFAVNDTISLRCVPSGTPSSAGVVYSIVRQSATSLSALLSGAFFQPSTSAVNYNGLQSVSSWNATISSRSTPMPTNGSFSNLTVKLNAAPGVGKSYTFTITLGGVDSAVTCTVSDTNTTASDTTHTVSVSTNTTAVLKCTPTGTPTAAGVIASVSFSPTVDGESVLLYNGGSSFSTTLANYDVPTGLGTTVPTSTETNNLLRLGATTITGLSAGPITAPGTGKSYAFTVRKELTSTSATVTIADTATTGNITGQSIAVNDYDRISLEGVPSGTPTASTVRAGISLYIAPSGGGSSPGPFPPSAQASSLLLTNFGI